MEKENLKDEVRVFISDDLILALPVGSVDVEVKRRLEEEGLDLKKPFIKNYDWDKHGAWYIQKEIRITIRPKKKNRG